MATLLRLLQPVESAWKTLARYLLKNELQYNVQAIETDCVQKDAGQKALDDVFSKWRDRTVRAQRTWQTLCNATRRYGDESLEQYIQANDLKSKFQFVAGLMKTAVYTYALFISICNQV